MKRWDAVAIVGVGLIGGSIGLALRRRRLATEVIGIGRRAASLRAARRVGAVTRTTLDLRKGVSRADLVVVCTPVDCIVRHVSAVAQACRGETLITDAGSIKAAVVDGVQREVGRHGRFVGSHPLAGSEQGGPDAASAELFDGRVVVVTPTRRTPAEDLQAVDDFWTALGGQVLHMPATTHDRIVAATSHGPHVVAAALADSTRADQLPLCASGWRDATRIAAGDPELWTQILLGNSDQTLKALESVERSLKTLRHAIQHGDATALKRILARAKRKRDALGS